MRDPSCVGAAVHRSCSTRRIRPAAMPPTCASRGRGASATAVATKAVPVSGWRTGRDRGAGWCRPFPPDEGGTGAARLGVGQLDQLSAPDRLARRPVQPGHRPRRASRRAAAAACRAAISLGKAPTWMLQRAGLGFGAANVAACAAGTKPIGASWRDGAWRRHDRHVHASEALVEQCGHVQVSLAGMRRAKHDADQADIAANG